MIKVEIEEMKIVISDDVLRVIDRYKQDKKEKNEAGGILLGQIRKGVVHVEHASIPNPFDKASRYNFERNKEIAQIIVNYEFANSANKTIYLGEWHTHPEKRPKPSGPDMRMMKVQYKKSKLNEPFLFMIIQGIEGIYIGLYNGKKLVKAKY